MYEYIYVPSYDEEWDKLGLSDEEQRGIENYLMLNPTIGRIMIGTGGLRKMRWGLQGSGKSGGLRVVYIYLYKPRKILMVDVYPKSQKDNLSMQDKLRLRAIVKLIIKECGSDEPIWES